MFIKQLMEMVWIAVQQRNLLKRRMNVLRDVQSERFQIETFQCLNEIVEILRISEDLIRSKQANLCRSVDMLV